ncbi:MAG: TRAM domain-containing protein, partial [Planctomycetia bacterium]|nr:TRAM domain-containing protein [Planctomycetia bacterium]
GRSVAVLVEGPSKRPQLDDHGHTPPPGPGQIQLAGRDPTNRIVVFNGEPRLAGREIAVKIVGASALTLFGIAE